MVLSDDFYYQPIRLDTINTQVYTDLLAKEGDAGGRGLKVTLTENGVVKNTTGITLNLKWEHTSVADLQGLEPFEVVDLTKGIYKLKYPTNMLQRGTVKAFIQIIDNGGLAGSRNIKIKVDSTVGDDTAIESSNEFAALVTALVKTNHMENLLNEAIANITVDSEVITARNSTAKGKTFTVLDQRIEEIEDDTYFPATNALVSPDFEAATGWTADKATLAVANNVASVTGNGTDAYANLYQSNTNVAVIGDKVYLRVRARVTNALCTSLQLSTTSFAQPVFINNPVANQWYDIYDVIDATATNAILTIRANYADAATANGKVMQVEKPVKINLTTAFGLLTPTVEQMYSLMSQFTNGHFKGTASLSQPALVLAKTLSMEAQFNAAIAGVTVDDETINARVGEDSTTHATLKARLDTEKSTIDQSLVTMGQQLAQTDNRIDNIVTSAGNYYLKCLQTDTGALLVVASGAIAGQINLASVSPRLDTFTPIVGDYVRLVSNALTAELVDVRIGADGKTYATAGISVRSQLDFYDDLLSEVKVPGSDNLIDTSAYEGASFLTKFPNAYTSYSLAKFKKGFLKNEESYCLIMELGDGTLVTDANIHCRLYVDGVQRVDANIGAKISSLSVTNGDTLSNLNEVRLAYFTSYADFTIANIRFVKWIDRENEYDGYYLGTAATKEYVDAKAGAFKLSGKSVYSFGDSLMYGHYSLDGILDGLVDAYNMVYTKYARNGDKILGTSAGSISYQIANASATEPDFIVFDGLTNDAYDDTVTYNSGQITTGYTGGYATSTFQGSFENILYNLRLKYPNAHIIYVTPHHMPTRSYAAQKTWHDAALEVCKKWAIPVVDIFDYGQINTNIDSLRIQYSYNNLGETSGGNGTHLTGAGYDKYYKPLIENQMLKMLT